MIIKVDISHMYKCCLSTSVLMFEYSSLTRETLNNLYRATNPREMVKKLMLACLRPAKADRPLLNYTTLCSLQAI